MFSPLYLQLQALPYLVQDADTDFPLDTFRMQEFMTKLFLQTPFAVKGEKQEFPGWDAFSGHLPLKRIILKACIFCSELHDWSNYFRPDINIRDMQTEVHN